MLHRFPSVTEYQLLENLNILFCSKFIVRSQVTQLVYIYIYACNFHIIVNTYFSFKIQHFHRLVLTSSKRLRKAECECTISKMYFSFSSAFGGKVNSTKAKQYCPLIPNFSSFALRHSSKSPNWFTFPLKIPDGILADASYTEIEN